MTTAEKLVQQYKDQLLTFSDVLLIAHNEAVDGAVNWKRGEEHFIFEDGSKMGLRKFAFRGVYLIGD